MNRVLLSDSIAAAGEEVLSRAAQVVRAPDSDPATLRRLAEYTVRELYPELGAVGPAAFAALLETVCRRTAVMIAHWMRVGFVHGVMNTDNMSVLGLTIDYGPYGWLEDFDPSWTPNTTDRHGRRYRFGHQPGVALWNLVRFAEALAPLVDDTNPLETALGAYESTLRASLRAMWLQKLGLPEGSPPVDTDPDRFAGEAPPLGVQLDDPLLDDLPGVLGLAETDMTIFFRRLADIPSARLESPDAELLAPLADAYYEPGPLDPERSSKTAAWLRRYLDRARAEGVSDDERRRRMYAVNPKFVRRLTRGVR